jgi:hypothetical protein
MFIYLFVRAGVAQSVWCLTTDLNTGVLSLADAKDFSSKLCVQTGSGTHLASCKIGTGGPFGEVKRGQSVTLTTHPHLVPK